MYGADVIFLGVGADVIIFLGAGADVIIFLGVGADVIFLGVGADVIIFLGVGADVFIFLGSVRNYGFFSYVHAGCTARENHALGYLFICTFLYKGIQSVEKKHAPSGCTGAKIYAPSSQNVHTGAAAPLISNTARCRG